MLPPRLEQPLHLTLVDLVSRIIEKLEMILPPVPVQRKPVLMRTLDLG
jgi:hypothetical protein